MRSPAPLPPGSAPSVARRLLGEVAQRVERAVRGVTTDLVSRPSTVAGRTLSALYLVSGASVALTAHTPDVPPSHARPMLLLAVVCWLVAVALWRRAVGQRLLGAVLVAGDLLTTAVVVMAPDDLVVSMLWNGYLLIAVCFALVTRLRSALLQLAALLTASSASLLLTGSTAASVVASALLVVATALPLCLLAWAARNTAVDPVTGLPNHRGADPVIAAALATADRTGAAAALAVVDVDGFGAVNTQRGWACGDELLVSLARELRDQLPPAAHLSRQGADTFLVLLPPSCDLAGRSVPQVLDDALAALSHPASAGVALHDAGGGESTADLVRRAATALAHAKKQRRGGTHLADPSTSSLARDLAAALADPAAGGLHVHLQPVVDVATGLVVGVEALARWSDPRRGAVSPLDFVGAAESSGQVAELGAFVVRAACREVAPLRERWGDGVFLTVNASGRELVAPGYVHGLLTALAEERLPATALVVEVTESVLDGGSPAAVAALHRLRAAGVRVAVDDFGAGYSCLTRLDEVPADFLKLDATLLATAPRSPRRRVLLATAVALADSLGLVAIAEGAETPEHSALLAELGCPLVQGFGHARPASAAELLAAGRHRPAAVPAAV